MKKSTTCLTVTVKGKTSGRFPVRKIIIVNPAIILSFTSSLKVFSFYPKGNTYFILDNPFLLKVYSFLSSLFTITKKVFFKIDLVFTFLISLFTKMISVFTKIISSISFFKKRSALIEKYLEILEPKLIKIPFIFFITLFTKPKNKSFLGWNAGLLPLQLSLQSDSFVLRNLLLHPPRKNGITPGLLPDETAYQEISNP